MTCTELTPLLELAPLLGDPAVEDDLLDAAEAQALEEHLASCAACRARLEELNGAYATWDDAREDVMQPLSPELKDRVLTERAAAQKKKGGLVNPPSADSGRVNQVRALIALSCSYCHDALTRDAAVFCAACLAPHHRECVEEHGACSTLGCNETRIVSPSELNQPKKPKSGIVLRLFLATSVAALTAGGIAALTFEKPDVALAPPAKDTPPRTSDSELLGEEPLLDDEAVEDLDEGELADPGPPPEPLKVDMDVEGMDLREALETIGRQVGENIIVLPHVQQEVTLELRDVAWREAVDRLARAGYSRAQDQPNGTVIVGYDPDRPPPQKPKIDAKPAPAPKLERPKQGEASVAVDANGRLYIDAEAIDLAALIDQIAEVSGLDAVVDRRIKETVRVSLHGIPPLEALEVMTRMTRCELAILPGNISYVHRTPTVGMQFKGADVHSIMRLLSKNSGHNVIVAPDVKGTFTNNFRRVPFRKAVETVAATVGAHVTWLGDDALVTAKRLPWFAKPSAPSRVLKLLPGARKSKTVTVSAKGLDLYDVTDAMGRQVGRNILVDPNVKETVTVHLSDVEWHHAVTALAYLTDSFVELRRGGIVLFSQAPDSFIEARGCPAKPLYQALAHYTGKSVSINDRVNGRITTSLQRTYPKHALHALAAGHGHRMEEILPDMLTITPGNWGKGAGRSSVLRGDLEQSYELIDAALSSVDTQRERGEPLTSLGDLVQPMLDVRRLELDEEKLEKAEAEWAKRLGDSAKTVQTLLALELNIQATVGFGNPDDGRRPWAVINDQLVGVGGEVQTADGETIDGLEVVELGRLELGLRYRGVTFYRELR